MSPNFSTQDRSALPEPSTTAFADIAARCRALLADLGLERPDDVSSTAPLTGKVASNVACVDVFGREVRANFAFPRLRRWGSGLTIIVPAAPSIRDLLSRAEYRAAEAGLISPVKAAAGNVLEARTRADAVCPGAVDSSSLRNRIRAQTAGLVGKEPARVSLGPPTRRTAGSARGVRRTLHRSSLGRRPLHHRNGDPHRRGMTTLTQAFWLAGRRALVTGSSQGIGLALAGALLDAGAEVVLNGRHPDRLAEAAASLDGRGDVRLLPFDVTDHAATRTAVDSVEATVGPIDILINNAGVQHRAPLEEFPADDFQRLLQVNVASVFNVGQACARHMIARRAGKIVNVASVQAALARPSIAPYTATKGAVANLTKGMAADWARHGLQCNAIAPGYFETPMNAALVADPAFTDWLRRRTPAGRWGHVDELGGVCVFLASNASSFVNGQVIYVDGGMTATL